MHEIFIWSALAFCITQSAALSGLNLAVFSLSRLRLEMAADSGDKRALRALALRRDSHFTLTTILWGNVGVNVLLTLLAESLMAGILAFLFSTLVITIMGEIIPQAYFTRHALRMVSFLSPMLRIYQVLLWPLAKPSSRLLDRWVGPEAIPWYQERELSKLLQHHASDPTTDVGHIEAIGARNFLALDDLAVSSEGEPLDPQSVISLPFLRERPLFPKFDCQTDDSFLKILNASNKKWVVITDSEDEPHFVLNAHTFLREALFYNQNFEPFSHCHRPLIVRDPNLPIGEVLGRLRIQPEKPGDDVIDEDVILVWLETERFIITGSDILGRLLRQISQRLR